MTDPIAIYRPHTRTLMLSRPDQSISIDEDRLPRLTDALRRVHPMLGPRSTLRIHNATGSLMVDGSKLLGLVDAIDAAFALRAS